MREIVRNLEKAREIITDPAAWTVGVRHIPDDKSPNGYARCALGAIEAAMGLRSHYVDQCTPEVIALADMVTEDMLACKPLSDYQKSGAREYKDCRVVYYNNYSTHADVLAWFDATIEFQKTAPEE